MKKYLWILLLLPFYANALNASKAVYDRNTARPVNQVVYGQIDSVRYITKKEMVHSQANGWQTLLGAVVGGLIGNQFGGGTGREVATAVGAVAGAGAARSMASKDTLHQYRLVELLIKTDQGKLVDVIQDVDPSMLFNAGEEVRILYFDDGVRVDSTY